MDIGTLTGTVSIEDQLSEALTLAIEHVKSFVEEFEGAMGTVAISAGIASAAIMGTVVSITALGEEGSKILGVEHAFDHLAESVGTTGEVLRTSLTEGVRGTLTEMALMESTSRLLGSGMRLTAEQANLMGAAARELGKATGGDAKSGLEIMSGALVTGRTRTLQMQIGLIDVVAGEEKFAASIGTTRDQLGAAGLLEGKRLAILEATQNYLDRLGVSELSFAEKVKQGWTAVEEWGETLAKTVAASKDVNEALDALGAAISDAFGAGQQSLMDTIVAGINGFSRAVTATVPYLVSFADGVKSIWNFLSDHMGVIVDTTKLVVIFGAAWGVWALAGPLVTGIVGGFTAITGSVTALTVAISANPLGAAAVAAVAAGLAIREYAIYTGDAAVKTETLAAQQDVMNRAIEAGDEALKGLAPSAENAAKAAAYLAGETKEEAEETEKASKADADHTQYLKDKKGAIDAIVASLEGESKKMLLTQSAVEQVIQSGNEDIEVKTRVIDTIDKLIRSHTALSDSVKEYYKLNSQLGTAEVAEAGKIADAWAKTDEAVAAALGNKAKIQEQGLLARNALELAYDQQLVASGVLSKTQYNQIKASLDTKAYNAHLDMLHAEEAAELTSNGVKMDNELSKLDERFAQGKVQKEQYEEEYLAITQRYAALRMKVEDDANSKISEAVQTHTLSLITATQGLGVAINSLGNVTNSYGERVTATTVAQVGWNNSIMMSHNLANVEMSDIGAEIANVHTLAGEWIKASEAKRAFDAGNTLDLATAAQDPEINELLKQGYSLKNAEAIKLGRQHGFTPQLFDEHGNPETAPSKSEGVAGYATAVAAATTAVSQLTTAVGQFSQVTTSALVAVTNVSAAAQSAVSAGRGILPGSNIDGTYIPPKANAWLGSSGSTFLGSSTTPLGGSEVKQTINVVMPDGRVLASVVNAQNLMNLGQKF